MNHELHPFPSRSSDLGPLIENARNYISNARSEATRRQYAASWNDFQRWNAAHGLRALPADPATVALFIADRSNLAGRLAAINYMQSCTEFDLHNGIADKTGIVAVILWYRARYILGTSNYAPRIDQLVPSRAFTNLRIRRMAKWGRRECSTGMRIRGTWWFC
jgi:hypothetical protein